jgi:Cys-tRNA(Pro)/Cys-tRNA(Cys) deacylase
MTPAVQLLKRNKVAFELHTFNVSDSEEGYGVAAARALGVEPELVFKTLLVSFNGDPKALGVCILPVTHNLSLKRAAKAHGQKSAQMADPVIAEKTTGYVLGGISPLGQKKRLPTFIDESARQFDSMFVSAGRRGLEIELSPDDLRVLTSSEFAALADAD